MVFRFCWDHPICHPCLFDTLHEGIPRRHRTISTPKLARLKLPKPPRLPSYQARLQESSRPLNHAEATAERVALIVTVTPLVWLDGSGGGVIPVVDVAVIVVETPPSVAGSVEEEDRGAG